MLEFSALEAIVKLGEISALVDMETRAALERAAVIVEKEAKAELGVYQASAAPFAPWAELADSTKDNRVKLGYSENEPGLRAGDMRDSIGHRVENWGYTASVGSNDDKAVAFELGTATQPPRSFLGGAAVRKTAEVVEELGEGFVTGLVGDKVAGKFLKIR